MLKNYIGILMLNEKEEEIKCLTKTRPIASIPIGGRYRIIDFVLSNMVNSGIINIGVYANTKSRSLVDHLGSGKPWDLDRKTNGLFLFNFTSERSQQRDVDVINDNIEYINRTKQEYVIIASSYMICNVNYSEAAKYHEASGSDITLLYKKINNGKDSFLNHSTVYIDEENKLLSIGKNIGTEDKLNISMEMFIMKKTTLLNIINKCIQTGYHNSIKEAIYNSALELNINAYEFKGYVKCVDSIKKYFDISMDMLKPKITKELFFNNGLIYTKSKDEAPTKYFDGSKVNNALISNGCILKGTVSNSIISRRVIVEQGAEVNNCIIFENCKIKKGCNLFNVIVDKNTVMEENTVLRGNKDVPVIVGKSNRSERY